MENKMNPMAKKVLLVEGNDERDLCSLLINKKLGLKCIIGKYDKTFIEDDNTIQIITINEADNKNHISSFIKTSNYSNIEKLAIVVDAESNAQKRFNIFNDIIKCEYNQNNNIYYDDYKGLFITAKTDDKTSGYLEHLVEKIILENDKDLYNDCVNNFFNCADNYINQGSNEAHLLKAKILAFISVRCKKRNTVGGLFQECSHYLDSNVLYDLIDFLNNMFK
ncbi:hypothetical protein A966_03555 [Brachyspira hampsonii 30446]|uniref:DUF4435 domain-containing protein n=1 Tax=Brachyspira hampsonii 30446 TaxID=1289135 RepID=A0A2U4F2Q3_9SPIR|nr:DUF3226 domain-containing protein [Brachyspira hampsonii]EKV57639.1 hypothetical protein A966_03555 [Brachyspira hampsonii 30446]MBW5394944.1 hypothetical protein [Brachyspira hampsonii]OEJ16259.1 hypothetical protein A9495_09255 [Brachyspira hampsonii]